MAVYKTALICEGPSEWTYIQRLTSFLLGSMPVQDDGFTPRLSIFPKITNNKIGGGSFKLVSRAFREFAPCNKGLPLHIWVDVDIYIRKDGNREKANTKAYSAKIASMPDFNFMVMNFEDFLAMHFDDELFGEWKQVMLGVNHFTTPLHGEDYAPHFEHIWTKYLESQNKVPEHYSKGSLDEDFICETSLKNMMRHCNDPFLSKLFALHAPNGTAFPILLSSWLKACYPEVFG